jgi:Trypsin
MTQNVLTVLWLALLTGCSAGSSSIADPSETASSEGLFSQGTLLVGPGPTDVANRFLPAVMLSTVITDSEGAKHFQPCSGVLIHPRLVITAGHCVCLPRAPEPDEVSPPSSARSTAVPRGRSPARASELSGVTLKSILDKNSRCAQSTLVTAYRYRRSPGGTPGAEISEHYDSEVRVHPQFEVLTGERGGRLETVWASADLAAIFLKSPVEFAFTPLELPTREIQVGTPIILVGYGPGDSPKYLGERQWGESKITQLLHLETGSVIFKAEEQALPDGGVSASAAAGDSGGPSVSKAQPRVLVGITSVGARTKDGRKVSIFMSAYSHLDWLHEALRHATRS